MNLLLFPVLKNCVKSSIKIIIRKILPLNNHKKILEKAKKIAVIRTDRLGDMVLTLPLCKAIKENFPDKELSLIAQKYTEPLLINSPVLDKYFFLNDYENGIHDIFKEQKFHVAFFPRPKFNEAYTAFKNRIPLRIGSGYRIYSFLFNHRVYDHRKTATRHEAEFNVRLLTSITNEQYKTELIRPYINPKTFSKLSNILEAKGFNFKEQYFIIHPGSGGSANEWEPKKFGKAASFNQLYRLKQNGLLIIKYNAQTNIYGLYLKKTNVKLHNPNAPLP